MFSGLMYTLRHMALRRWVLAWFTLAVLAATASPLLKPQTMELLCSGNSAMKLLIKSSDGEEAQTTHTLQCALCLPAFAPAPQPQLTSSFMRSDLAYATQRIPSAVMAALTQPPLPARGPPALS
jgi:hypothetical protein